MIGKLKYSFGILFCMVIILSIIPLSVKHVQAEESTEIKYYLSDMEWYSATHGDADNDKTVQKDHPFTPGNNGEDTKISLLMEDGTTEVFDKGLGTVAASPSSIIYNITGAEVSRFTCYAGLDRTSNNTLPGHAQVEKIEVIADEEIVFSTEDIYPNGIDYNTPAILIDIDIAQDAEKIELRSYAGEQTWGDEIVYADASFIASGTFPRPDDWTSYYYLSNLNWTSATHGDSDTSKQVQKDHPFTPGNNGEDTPIRLLMQNGNIRTFEKGLGTVAAYPSEITYNINGAGVSEFKAHIGIDRSANYQAAGHAIVEKIEILADDTILYSSQEDYPEGILYTTPAIRVDVEVPENASMLHLKCYAGEQTWADEIVYADAKVVAEGPFIDPDAWEPEEKRREISNQVPLMMIPLYANGEKYAQAERQYTFWGDDTLTGKWEEVPDDLKPYTVIELHPDDLPKQNGSAADFYEHYLEEAQNYVNPKTGENEPIPLVLTVYTAGNQYYYTAAHWLTTAWIEEMYEQYSCLQGIFCTENYWVWASGIENMAAEYLTISAKHGGYFIWSEQNNGASIEKAMGTQGQTAFKEAVEKYSDYFIFMYKNTPAAEGNDAPTSSYMTGLWLTDYVYQWGGLMDTWKWYETGKWKLFESDNIGKTQGNRQWLSEPEALLGIEAMMIYLNGGCVYNFEHPAYTYGVKNEQSPLYTNVIQEFFRYAVENPAPTKDEMLNSTKTIIHGNLSSMGNGNFFVGLNTEMTQSPTYITGRYGNIPAVPSSISSSVLEEKFSGTGIEIVEQGDERIQNMEKRQAYFNSLYENMYDGDIFAQKLEDTWYVYNYKYNEDVNQTAENMSLSVPGVTGGEWNVSAVLEPHTYLIIKEKSDGITVRLNNYRTNKDELWEGAQNASEAAVLPEMSKKDALSWVYTNYINNTQDQERRTTTITLTNLENEPTINNVSGLEGNYTTPEIVYDAETKTANITVISNGYVYFDIMAES